MSSVNIMHEWFKHIFEQRMDKRGFVSCFECGRLLHEDSYKDNTVCYSHILAKRTHPKYAGIPSNVEIVCPDCHNLYSITPSRAVKQYSKYKEMLKQIENED